MFSYLPVSNKCLLFIAKKSYFHAIFKQSTLKKEFQIKNKDYTCKHTFVNFCLKAGIFYTCQDEKKAFIMYTAFPIQWNFEKIPIF